MGVTEMSVRFMDTWAMPYSSMNQPMALTVARVPGSHMGLPSSFSAPPVR